MASAADRRQAGEVLRLVGRVRLMLAVPRRRDGQQAGEVLRLMGRVRLVLADPRRRTGGRSARCCAWWGRMRLVLADPRRRDGRQAGEVLRLVGASAPGAGRSSAAGRTAGRRGAAPGGGDSAWCWRSHQLRRQHLPRW